MIQYKEVLRQFGINFSNEDEIKRSGVYLAEFKDKFICELLTYVKKNSRKNDAQLDDLVKKYGEYIDGWYKNIITAKLNNGLSHFIINFNAQESPRNYFDDEKISSMFSFIRNWFHEKVYGISDTEWEYNDAIKSYTKLLDASMYVVMSIYIKSVSGTASDSKLKFSVLHYGERFSLYTHIVLLFFLGCMTVGGIFYFVYSLFGLRDVSLDQIFVNALGSLLVLWVLVELINSEIQMLQGDKFRISIFVGVVLIAFIRELLILSLKHQSSFVPMATLIGGVLVLGITYWLLARAEKSQD